MRMAGLLRWIGSGLAAGVWFGGTAGAAPAAGTIWLSEHPGHRPALGYPASYALAWQALGFGFLNVLDRDATGFESPSYENFLDGFRDGPHFDDDDWQWNYVAHPLWGSETYLRARSQGFGPLGSLLFSAGASVVWEFGIESWSQRPSLQDLTVTPLAGMLLGELRFSWKRQLLEQDDPGDALWLLLVDPLQTLTEAVGRAFGQDWREPAWRRVDPTLPLAEIDYRSAPVACHFATIDRRPGVMLRWRLEF